LDFINIFTALRMILGLMILQKNYVINLLNGLAGFYGQEHKQRLLENFQFLIMNVPPDFSEKNKETFYLEFQKFTNNLNGIS